jgi:hypothetical protein
MPRLESRNWPADPSVPGPRRERQSLRYIAYVPDRMAQVDIRLSAAIAGVVSAAERMVDSLNRAPPILPSLDVLARRLLRAESVASSRIEGLELSQRRLAEAEAAAACSCAEEPRGGAKASRGALSLFDALNAVYSSQPLPSTISVSTPPAAVRERL